jgi:hypothetical protein
LNAEAVLLEYSTSQKILVVWTGMATYRVFNVPFMLVNSSLIAAVSGRGV